MYIANEILLKNLPVDPAITNYKQPGKVCKESMFVSIFGYYNTDFKKPLRKEFVLLPLEGKNLHLNTRLNLSNGISMLRSSPILLTQLPPIYG